MSNSPQLYVYFCLTLLSSGVCNFAGVSITKQMSATTRMILDPLRTILIWFCSMMLYFLDKGWGMPSFKDEFWLQLGGFFFVVIGLFVYNDVLIMPFIRQRKAKKTDSTQKIQCQDIESVNNNDNNLVFGSKLFRLFIQFITVGQQKSLQY